MDVRKKLVELIYNNSPRLVEEEAEILANRLIAHGVTVQEWIPVTERLPNVNTNKSGYETKGVIVCIDGGTTSRYRIYERSCNRGKTVYRWKYPWDKISNENITHWCEMPQPPKGE